MGSLDFNFGFLRENYPLHYHDCYEFHYILNGRGVFIQDNLHINLQNDVFLVSPPGMEHSFLIDPDITFYYLRYKADDTNRDKLCSLSSSYQLSGESRVTLSKLRTLLGGDDYSRLAGEHLFLYFLFSLIGDNQVERFIQAPILKCQEYMMQNLSKKMSLQELADQVHLEKHYFCRLFKESTNVSPLSYFERLKMEAACSMIEQGTRGYRVAELLGFCDETYFCNRFKKVVGMSPGAFRRSKGRAVN